MVALLWKILSLAEWDGCKWGNTEDNWREEIKAYSARIYGIWSVRQKKRKKGEKIIELYFMSHWTISGLENTIVKNNKHHYLLPLCSWVFQSLSTKCFLLPLLYHRDTKAQSQDGCTLGNFFSCQEMEFIYILFNPLVQPAESWAWRKIRQFSQSGPLVACAGNTRNFHNQSCLCAWPLSPQTL